MKFTKASAEVKIQEKKKNYQNCPDDQEFFQRRARINVTWNKQCQRIFTEAVIF